MTDWFERRKLPKRTNKIAVLELWECQYGIIQRAHRDDADYKLSIEETRKAMNFKGKNKRMTIEPTDETITLNRNNSDA